MKKLFINLPLFIIVLVTTIGCQQKGSLNMSDNKLEVTTLGGGCFWCVEAVFERVEGVKDVVSGYAGGHFKKIQLIKIFPEEILDIQKYVKFILIQVSSAMIKFWIFSGRLMIPPP